MTPSIVPANKDVVGACGHHVTQAQQISSWIKINGE